MSSKSSSQVTQRTRRKKDAANASSSDLPSNGQASAPLPPESPTPQDHESCRRELAEAKLLAANLEKTVRWWAECASKWKERWARANAERHRAKKEARGLKQQVADLSKEVRQLREELEGLKTQGASGEKDTGVQGPAGPAADTNLGALETEVREVLQKLDNWRASGEVEGEAEGTMVTILETES